MEEVVEVRCPAQSKNLLMKMRMDPEAAQGVSINNGILLFCRSCTQYERRVSGRSDFRVIHEFSVLGEFLGSYHEDI